MLKLLHGTFIFKSVLLQEVNINRNNGYVRMRRAQEGGVSSLSFQHHLIFLSLNFALSLFPSSPSLLLLDVHNHTIFYKK